MGKTKRKTDEDQFVKKSKKSHNSSKSKKNRSIKDKLRHINSIDDWTDPDEDD